SACLCVTATAPPQIYTLSLHDALPISAARRFGAGGADHARLCRAGAARPRPWRAQRDVDRPLGSRRSDPDLRRPAIAQLRRWPRSEEHTSELQSLAYLVCRLLLEKKKK